MRTHSITHSTTSRRRVRLVAAIGAALLLASGCASAVTGTGRGSGTIEVGPTEPPPTGPSGPTNFPSETTTPPTSEPPTSEPPSSSAPGICSADYCEDFSSKSTGWDTGNEHFFYSEYDSYLGGTFRMGERHNSILTVPAPFDLGKASRDNSVQVSVDMYLGDKSAQDSLYGISCWNHKSRHGETSAFLFYISKQGLEIALWDNKDGSEHTLKRKSWNNVLKAAPKPNNVRVLCFQRRSGSTRVAELGVVVNGHALTEFYTNGSGSKPWTTGDRVALLVGLTGSDVFYDNFSISGG